MRRHKNKYYKAAEVHLVVIQMHIWAWYHLPLNIRILCLSASSRVTLYS